MDVEDELVAELDVYLMNDYSEELWLFQYPLRPHDRFYGDHSELSNVLFNKQENNSVKLIYSIESKMKNFDNHNYEQRTFTQTILGQKVDINTNYALGVLRDNALFLNPLSNVMQFRNDFSHMEIDGNLKKKTNKPLPPTATSLSRKESNYTSLMGESKEEMQNKWVNFQFYKSDSIQSHQLKDKLYFDKKRVKVPIIDSLSSKEYSKLLFKNINLDTITEIINEKQNNRDKSISFKELKELAITNKIFYLLKKIPVISFNSLRSLLAELGKIPNSEEELLEIILKFSRITKNGKLILNSDLRYDAGKRADLVLKRNILINLLQDNPEGIYKKEITFLPLNELDEILSEVAEHVGNKYVLKTEWNENESEREYLGKNFPKLYQKEMNFWDSVHVKQISQNKDRLDKMEVDSGDIVSGTQPGHSNITKNNNLDAINPNSIIHSKSKFNLDLIRNIITKTFQNNKSDCLYLSTLENAIFKDLNITNESEDLKQSLNDMIDQLCYKVNGICYLKDIGEGELNIARKKLLEYFIEKKTLKKNETKNFLKSIDIELTDSNLNKILKSIGVYSNNAWSLKAPSN
jgi:hypothetical protein